MSASLPERLHDRIRAEYLEMPGMRLTLQEVQRLCGIERTMCQMVLDSLVTARFLWASSDGHYARMVEGPSRRHAAWADADPNGVS